jgi:hypothetical protein
MGATAAGLAVAGLAVNNTLLSEEVSNWNPDLPLRQFGKKIKVQPVLMYSLSKRKEATSWRPWGGLHTHSDVENEKMRINRELEELTTKADYMDLLPLIEVNSVEMAEKVNTSSRADVMVIYAASGGGNILESLASDKRDNIIFLRHRSGPVYLWYEIVHCRFLRKGGNQFELNTFRDPGDTDINDIVVDSYDDLSVKLKALFGVKNFIGKRIVTLGGPAGWCCPAAPQVSRDKFNLEYCTVNYDDLGQRIIQAKNDSRLMKKAQKWAELYLKMPNTHLNTDKQFVVNAFMLYKIFKDLMVENETDMFTIKSCMSTVIPMAETTACLPLSLLNDEGYTAFCESDFNVIPSGILLRYISGKPVFLNDPTFPHHNIVTCAHCTAPRRMDGQHYSKTQVVTHFESDYGAAPKIDLPMDTKVTMICPDSPQKEWLGFRGTVVDNPFMDICRAQYDIQIEGDYKKLINEMRGFHWMMACGDYTKEMEYACSKINIGWNNISNV